MFVLRCGLFASGLNSCCCYVIGRVTRLVCGLRAVVGSIYTVGNQSVMVSVMMSDVFVH